MTGDMVGMAKTRLVQRSPVKVCDVIWVVQGHSIQADRIYSCLDRPRARRMYVGVCTLAHAWQWMQHHESGGWLMGWVKAVSGRCWQPLL